MPNRYGDSDDEEYPGDPRLESQRIAEAARLARESRSHLRLVPDAKTRREQIEALRQRRIAEQKAREEARAAGIPDCTGCDDAGYRPSGLICDHVDRTGTVARGRELVRAAMGWGSTDNDAR